jgi:hypothetical protein
MQMFAAATSRPLPWSAALMLLTIGLAILSQAVLLTDETASRTGRRALWNLRGLALFAVSALAHLSRSHPDVGEGWPTELLGSPRLDPLGVRHLYHGLSASRFVGPCNLKRAADRAACAFTVVFVAVVLGRAVADGEPTGSQLAGCSRCSGLVDSRTGSVVRGLEQRISLAVRRSRRAASLRTTRRWST